MLTPADNYELDKTGPEFSSDELLDGWGSTRLAKISLRRFSMFSEIDEQVSERLICFDAFELLCQCSRELMPLYVQRFHERHSEHTRSGRRVYNASALLVWCISDVSSPPYDDFPERMLEDDITDTFSVDRDLSGRDSERRIPLALRQLVHLGFMVANGDVIRKLAGAADASVVYRQWIDFANTAFERFPSFFDVEPIAPELLYFESNFPLTSPTWPSHEPKPKFGDGFVRGANGKVGKSGVKWG